MTGFREFVRSSMNESVDMSSRVDHTYDNNLQKDLAKRIYDWIYDEDPGWSALQKMVQNALPPKQKIRRAGLKNNGSLLVIVYDQKIEALNNDQELSKLGKKLESVYKAYLQELGIFDNVKVELKGSYDSFNRDNTFFEFKFKVSYDIRLKNLVIPPMADGSGSWK